MWNPSQLYSKSTSGVAVVTGLATLFFVMMAMTAGCGGEEEATQYKPEQRGDRGESCTARNECQSGLACVNGTCVENEYNISQEAGHCEMLECQQADDCCSFPPCEDWVCMDNQCIEQHDECNVDNDCFSGICVDNQCVECEFDSDCDSGEQCIDGFCDEGCTFDANCPLFHECSGGECQHVGCQTDRECVLFANHQRAECSDEVGECTVPCDNDAECNTGESGFFQICNDGICEFVGCNTDEECRAAFELENMPEFSQAVCR